jgi:hypothetical protein
VAIVVAAVAVVARLQADRPTALRSGGERSPSCGLWATATWRPTSKPRPRASPTPTSTTGWASARSGAATRNRTTTPPAPAPGRSASSYEDAWRYTLTHPDDPGSDWQWALTNAIATVGNGRPSAPTFDHVVTRPDGLEMSGRYATAGGGAGTFELARLRARGPWFVLRLGDDGFHVRNVEVTPTEARVTIVVAEDYRLAVARSCGGSAGQPVEEAWGHAGVELLCVFPMDPPGASDRTARSRQTLETTSGNSLLRCYDAWPP